MRMAQTDDSPAPAATTLKLYELASADETVRFSPHCWKTRMALAHKGLNAERIPWRFTDKDVIAFSGQGLVPVLVDGEAVVNDSWRIAEHLEERYPHSSLFGGDTGRAVARFVNSWADGMLVPAIIKVIAVDIHNRIAAKDQGYFRQSRERRFGMSLEAFTADTATAREGLRHALAPLRFTLRQQAFVCGATPAYADYCVFGMMMWARCISPVELLEQDDPVFAWRERLLDAHDGLARHAPRAQ
ncbi:MULTISPECIES: glutathione S-transferase family protein [unclassified Chelatococcus]|uniref:glutathione S-transferase family protein n=1 Tax=unclassified Chelatococcus TaxID=2638111 RepID=UPI0020C02BE3|nr:MULTISPECIES: glutathione S-transferase family protein [unclassified Chelatococcus]MCO5076463.1 glutathione S-transferase family protein [Chelatococcus sp.]CAH1671996.1 Glutathione S-transferase [Hyphomicrobiales bacterium]CAH1675785.1 Glutathione S-transferase [Hyphomicrobiales bacterium]